MSKLKATPIRTRTYPTGLKVQRCEYRNASGTLKIEVEYTLREARNGIRLAGLRAGDAMVGGSLIPKGATGLIRHETLPDKPVPRMGRTATIRQARRIARKMFRHFEPYAA